MAEFPELPPVGEGLGGRTVTRVFGERSTFVRVALTVAFLAGLAGIAFAVAPWGYVALGFAAGALVAWEIPAATHAVSPVYALGRAAAPLLLPVLVFVAAGVVKTPWWLQIGVSVVTLLAAWFWLIGPDREVIAAALRPHPWQQSGFRRLLRVVLPGLGVLAALLVILSSVVDVVGERADTSSSLFVLAVGFLAGAVVLRVVGYANTVLRVPLTIALFALLTHLGMKVGIVPAWDPLEDADTGVLAAVAGAALAIAVAGEVAGAIVLRETAEKGLPEKGARPWLFRIATAFDKPVAAHAVTDRAAAAGVLFSLASALCLLIAVYHASQEGGAEESAGRGVEAGRLTRDYANMPDPALAEMYSPVLLFTGDQRWTPIAVDQFVDGAQLHDWEGRAPETVATDDDLPTTCPGVVKSPCYLLVSKCDGRPRDVAVHARCAEDLADDKAVYVRVARKKQWAGCKERSKPCADGSPNPFARANGDHAKTTSILVQYWYFYPFNEWVAPAAVGDLKQVHAADWEAVTVGLSDTEPLWVAYSAHCAGTFAEWDTVRLASDRHDEARPLVAVAHGSQANYRVAEESRVPNFAECSGIPRDRLSLASYAANIRDRTDDSEIWTPEPTDLHLVTAADAPMSFQGRWAAYNYMRLDNLKEHQLGKEPPPRGPESPPFQTLWQRPMEKIFGGDPWKQG